MGVRITLDPYALALPMAGMLLYMGVMNRCKSGLTPKVMRSVSMSPRGLANSSKIVR